MSARYAACDLIHTYLTFKIMPGTKQTDRVFSPAALRELHG